MLWLQWIGLACPASLAALVLFLLVSLKLDRRKRSRAARTFACTRCGKLLGDAAIDLADELWSEHMRALRERHPDVKFRIVRELDAACPHCGARFHFIATRLTFVEKWTPLDLDQQGDEKGDGPR